ncbi:hypothetical protein PG990_013298 [Apiospora arundinis]
MTMSDGDSEPTRHACQCGKSFIRKEHLIRHQATHGSPSHVCPQCQRSFTRNDLLRRHLQRHTETVANGRRGVARACDACHDNKTRCVGGTPCSLCVKRGVACSLVNKAPKDGAASSTHKPRQEPSASLPPQAEKQPDADAGPSLNAAQIIGMMSVRGEEEQNDPANYVEHMRETLESQGPEEAIRQLLLGNRSRSLSLLREPSGQFESFAEECLKTYLDAFHDAWPFLHTTTLDLTKDNLHLASSVIVIGILLRKDVPDISRSKAVSCHETMMSQFFQHLIETPRGSAIEQWPMEWYQAVLLNIISGIMRNEFPRSRLLCSLFIAHLRLVGVFDSTVAEAQTKIYQPGTFLPFVLTISEQRSRLIAYLFKVDALLSLLDGQPPMLHAEELDTRLPQTFALWNAYGLDVFFKRHKEEPGHRASHTLSDIVSGPFRFTTSNMVVEDVEFGLWTLVREIWRHRQRQRMERERASDTNISDNDNTQSTLLHRLRGWKYQLINLQRLCSSDATTGEEAESALRLIRAYRGDDDERPNEEWQVLARNRANGRVREALNLHDVLVSCLHNRSKDIGIRSTLLLGLSLTMGLGVDQAAV